MKINHFSYLKEPFQNPYTGIFSFQHFGTDVLYSDMVVRPENNMTETEHYECYPIPEYVLQNGKEEGYYPQASVVYIRILWKEFEREQGVYNYGFIEEILENAKKHHQSLIFRLMPHSTRACDDVPEWLKSLIDCPERPDGKRVKDSPTDPEFLKLFSKAVRKLGERFDADETFDSIDICLPGAWGEGHKLHLYKDEDIRELYDAYIEAFPNTRLICQIGRPELIEYVSQKSEFGWRGDGLGEPNHLTSIYPPRIEKVKDLWKIAPVSFETYWWPCEWQRKGWDIDDIIEKTLSWHISSLNPKSFPFPMEWKDKVDRWVEKMGYHFYLKSCAYDEKVSKGGKFRIKLNIENTGVAPIYKKLPVSIKLSNEKDVFVFKTDTDITKWMPGDNEEEISVILPDTAEMGKYVVSVKIESKITGYVSFATDAECENGYYRICETEAE